MRTTHCTVAVLLMAVVLAAPLAHADMMEKDKGMMKETPMMGGRMTGMLTGAKDHHASGTVVLTKDMGGHILLRVDNLKVDKVPDGRVYLAKDGDYTKGLELGKLTQFSGMVEYVIPTNVNPADYNSVVIWCRKFNVEIGRATLAQGAMMPDDHMQDKGMMKP